MLYFTFSNRIIMMPFSHQGDDFWKWFSENDVGELVGEAGVAMRVDTPQDLLPCPRNDSLLHGSHRLKKDHVEGYILMCRELSLNEQRRKKCQEDYAHPLGKINWHRPTPPPTPPPDPGSPTQPPDAGSPTQPPDAGSPTQPPDAGSPTQLLPGDSDTEPPDTSSDTQPPDASSDTQLQKQMPNFIRLFPDLSTQHSL